MKMKVHKDKCIGCNKCITACLENHEVSRIKIVKDNENQPKPLVCRQCESPQCAAACTYEAFWRNKKTNAVLIDEKLCQACHACVRACPFDSIVIHPETKIAITCDLCGGNPACVEVCETGAIEVLKEPDDI